MDIIKVSANSRTSAVAGAIAGVVREHKRAEVQAIGAGAVNQAVKGVLVHGAANQAPDVFRTSGASLRSPARISASAFSN